jgi:hypothetical protein
MIPIVAPKPGQKFGRLEALKEVGRTPIRRELYWAYICDCDRFALLRVSDVRYRQKHGGAACDRCFFAANRAEKAGAT